MSTDEGAGAEAGGRAGAGAEDGSSKVGSSKVDEDVFDRLRRRVLWSMPSGLYVIGSRAGDRRNGMTLSWATQVSIEPKQVGISVLRTAFTHELIEEGRVFSVNIIGREDRSLVRKFVKPVEVNIDQMTLNGFGFTNGRSGAPILDLAVAYVDCELRQKVEVGDHTFFIGEVVDVGFRQSEDMPVLRMEDTRMNYGG